MVAIATIYVKYTQIVVDGWDPVAYLYAGEQLAQDHGLRYCHPFNETIGPYFTLAGFNIRRNGDNVCLYLNYPPGFPLLLAVAQKVSGVKSVALYVPALCGIVGVFMTFTIGTLLFNRWVGAISALSLGFTPIYMSFSTAPWSDVPGVVLLVISIAALIGGNRQKQVLVQVIMGSVSGVLICWSIFTRYVNSLILWPLAAYLWLKHGSEIKRLRSAQAFGGCLLIGALGILLFNQIYYGGFLTTSYSPQHGWYDWPAFHLRYAFGSSPVGGKSLLAIIKTIWANYSWLMVVAGAGWVSMRTPERVLTLGATLIFAGLYSFYAFPAEGINARFLVSVLPFISLAIGYGLWSSVRGQWQWWWRGIATLLLLIILFVPLHERLQGLAERNGKAAVYVANLTNVIGSCCEPEAVFLAYNTNDVIVYYGRRTTLFYRRIPSAGFKEELVALVRRLLDKGIPVYYVQDSDPPFGNSLAILERAFDLNPLQATLPSVYKINRKSSSE
jgi:hypothetical protein